MYNKLQSYLCENKVLLKKTICFYIWSLYRTCTVRLNQISEFFNRNNYFLGNFIDLLKVFDAVNHQMLLKKITLLWHQIQNLKQFLSYLSNRKQCMEHYNRNNKTDFSDITYGVPQGSILGPLIFIIFTNNLHCASNKLELIVFADDTTYSFQTET